MEENKIVVELSVEEFKTVEIALLALLHDVNDSLKNQWLNQDPLDIELRDRVMSLCKNQFHARHLVK